MEQLSEAGAELLGLQDRLASSSSEMESLQAAVAAKDSSLADLSKQMAEACEKEQRSGLEIETLRIELQASEETVASMQADLEAERQLAYNQSAAHSLALELAEQHLYGSVCMGTSSNLHASITASKWLYSINDEKHA